MLNFFNDWKNKIYEFVNVVSYKYCDEMWDISPRMIEAREKILWIKKTDYNLCKLVPFGLWLDRIQYYEYEKCEKNTLVFMWHLLEKQWVQIVIKAIPDIIKTLPQFKFKIIWIGPYKEFLENLAKEYNVSDYCCFMWKIDDNIDLENEIAKSCVAIAPYIRSIDTWTYYADPWKIKTYIACWVPLLLSDISRNSKDIEKNACWILIDENNTHRIQRLLYLMQPDINIQYRKNSILYSKSFDYNNIFNWLLE